LLSQNPLNADENTISLEPVSAIEAESKNPPADPVVTVEYPVEVANDDTTKLALLSKEAVKFADDGGIELYNLNTIFSPAVKL
jgi:ribosomal protein L24